MVSTAQIKLKIQEKLYNTQDIRQALEKNKRKFQSPVWNTFQAILNEQKEVILTHVCCKFCQEVFKNTVTLTVRRHTGTSNLLRHEKVCRARLRLIANKKVGK